MTELQNDKMRKTAAFRKIRQSVEMADAEESDNAVPKEEVNEQACDQNEKAHEEEEADDQTKASPGRDVIVVYREAPPDFREKENTQETEDGWWGYKPPATREAE